MNSDVGNEPAFRSLYNDRDSRNVELAIRGVWAGIGLSALVALVDKLTGDITPETFVLEIFAYGLMSVIPYKLQQRSNAARYWLLVLSIIGVLLEIGGVSSTPRLDLIIGWLWTPVSIAILVVLFSAQSSAYFSGKPSPARATRIDPDLGQ